MMITSTEKREWLERVHTCLKYIHLRRYKYDQTNEEWWATQTTGRWWWKKPVSGPPPGRPRETMFNPEFWYPSQYAWQAFDKFETLVRALEDNAATSVTLSENEYDLIHKYYKKATQ